MTNEQIIQKLADLPLIVRGSSDEVFRRIRELQEAARKEPSNSRLPAPSVAPEVDGISWTALLVCLERLRSKTRDPEAEWYHGWNAAIQCLINDINGRATAPVSPVAPVEQSATEIIKRIRDKLINGNPRSLLADIAELVSVTAPQGESKCEHGIPWSMECLSCGHSDYVPASPAALILHCPCGAACTTDEYAAHRAMGHDAPVGLRDEATPSSLPNAPDADPNRRCWASTTNEVCFSPRDCDDRGCRGYADEDYRSKYNQPTSKDIRAELIAAHSVMPRRHCAVHNREEFKYESLEHELRAATTPPSTLAKAVAKETTTKSRVEKSEPPALDCLIHGHEWKQEGTKHFCTHCGTGVDVGPTADCATNASLRARAAAEQWFATPATHFEDDQDAINALTAIIERCLSGGGGER